MKPYLIPLGVALALVIGILMDLYQTRRLIKVGVGLAERAIPFSRKNGSSTILVMGDSTAVGTGASSSSASLAGLLGQTYPAASIENRGVNGAVTHDLIERFSKIEGQYDLIMIHIGGNDTVHMTALDQLQKDLETVIRSAKQHSKKIVIVSTGNVGTAKLLPFGTRWLFTAQTRKVRKIFKQTAALSDATYVDLFREADADPFAKNPSKYYAADSFHPSDAGYADWFALIKPNLPKI